MHSKTFLMIVRNIQNKPNICPPLDKWLIPTMEGLSTITFFSYLIIFLIYVRLGNWLSNQSQSPFKKYEKNKDIQEIVGDSSLVKR